MALRTALGMTWCPHKSEVVAKLAGEPGLQTVMTWSGPGSPAPLSSACAELHRGLCARRAAVPPVSADGTRVCRLLWVARTAKLDRFCCEASPRCHRFRGRSLVKLPFVCRAAKYWRCHEAG